VKETTWCWRRGIAPHEAEGWIARLQAVGCATWTLTERPGRVRHLLAVYDVKRGPMAVLQKRLGGQVVAIRQNQWLPPGPRPPTRIGKALAIHHDPPQRRLRGDELFIPHGIAFGSGEHATTFMLLRALAREPMPERVLDLGTGSGVLALAARKLGAQKIVATDFDPDAVRTARENEARNFSKPAIRWQRAEVKRLPAKSRYDLVLANLFSGILIEAAGRIAACVAPGGKLWLSGILRAQQDEVLAAYRARGLRLIGASRRGKWIMAQFDRFG